ncbi:MAG: DUF2079 domain-containing protein [Chloroflexi bacterium]|nr:DUF2079 domain-containing protein [Chloroflexota bacterium]
MSKTQNVQTFIREHRAVLIMVTIWAIVLAGFSILRHERLNSSVYDFGIKSQVIWNTANGRWFASSIEVTQYLGDHFQLIFLPLAALYRLWPNPNALLLVQSLLLALAAVPLYRIANRHLHSQKLALAFAAAYLLYPAVGFINRFDFHPITFVVFFFLMAIDLAETDRPWWASFFIFLALITREEMGLTIFALGLFVIFVEKRPLRRCSVQARLGVVWAVVGLVYSAVILLAVMPAFRGGATDSMLRYAWLGGGPADMAQTLLTRPAFVLITLLGDPVRQEFLLKILLPVGFLSLLSPLALAVALPALGYNLLSDVPSQSSIYFQYMSPIIPFIFLAAILGAATLQKWLNACAERQPKAAGRSGRISPKAASRQFTWGLIIWLGVFTLLAWLLDNPFTTRIDAPYYPIYALEQTSSRTAFNEARALLPPDAPVATMMGYGTHLSLRPELYLFYDRLKLMERPYAFPPVEYALLNLTDLRWDVNARIFYSAIETAIGRLGYEALYFQDDVVLLRQMDEPQPMTGAVLQQVIDLEEAGGKYAPTAPSTLDWLGRQWVMERLPDTAVSQPIPFAENITLSGYELSEDRYAAGRPLCVTLYWQADAPLATDYTAFVHLTAPDGYVQAQRDSAPAFGFHPTSQWQPGEITADMHCFQLPPQLPLGPYQIKAGIYDPNTGSRLPLQDAAIPATDNAAILTEILIEPSKNP